MNCPDCGSSSVSVEVGPVGMGRLTDVVVRAAEGDAVEVVRACWACGRRDTREVVVESIDVDPGDPAVVARRRLIDRVTERLSELDEDGLGDALTAIEWIADG